MTRDQKFHWPWPDTPAETLLQRARTAAERAYAPYSRFKVGAALLTSDGSVVLGCNVENASYGMTSCAERNAVASMIAMGHLDPVAIAVVGGKSGTPCPPCGACRQVLAEFNPDMMVVLESPNKIIIMSVNELLPLSFSLTERV
ncbi:MAG: cytidine deaminase [Synergistaceae bacterium]|jgi:cytidine deaminase|nr:cytidine deaminase [Synergistaceae bacterium]